MPVKPQAWEAHEDVYRGMKKRGKRSWNEMAGKPAVEPAVKSFLVDALRQSGIPERGRAIELGCGTAPFLKREFAKIHSVQRRGVIYHPVGGAERYDGAVTLHGKPHLPIRFLEPWPRILERLGRAGFETRLFRVVPCRPDDPLSYFSAMALKKTR